MLEMWRLVGEQPTFIEVKGPLRDPNENRSGCGAPCLWRIPAEGPCMETRRCFWSPSAHPNHQQSAQQQVQSTSSHPRRQLQVNGILLDKFVEVLLIRARSVLLGANSPGGSWALFMSARKMSIGHDRYCHFLGCFPLPPSPQASPS